MAAAEGIQSGPISIASRSSSRQDTGGALQKKVYDVAGGEAQTRKLDANGRLPPVGNTIEVANATWTNTIGDPELITV